MALRASILDETHRKALEISRLLNTLPKEQRDKLESGSSGGSSGPGSGRPCVRQVGRYIRGTDVQAK
jgi:hypothetical protein